MKKFYVYVHTCTANGKRYVGCTTQARPELRWQRGRGYQHNDHFYRAILKHGWNNFQHEVFEVESEEEMYRKEVELISFYHSNDPRYGYNHSSGGEKSASGCIRSEEFVKHLSEIHKEKWLDSGYRKKMLEIQKKIHSDPEYIEKLSKAHKGKLHSEEHKKHLAEAKKGKPRSEEFRKHLSETLKGKPLPKVKIKLQDGTILEITKQNLGRHYINKGKKFEYVD